MIHPITVNHTNTVGLCDGEIPESDYLGLFKASLLKEWVSQILHNYGDVQIALYCHASDNTATTAHVLAAAERRGDDMFVCVVGAEDRKEED